MGVKLLNVLTLPVPKEARPYIVWHAIDRNAIFGVSIVDNKMVIATIIWDIEKYVCKARRVGLTFEIVRDLVQLLLFSDNWRSKVSSKHTDLAHGIRQKLENLIAFWEKNGYHDGWLSEIL